MSLYIIVVTDCRMICLMTRALTLRTQMMMRKTWPHSTRSRSVVTVQTSWWSLQPNRPARNCMQTWIHRRGRLGLTAWYGLSVSVSYRQYSLSLSSRQYSPPPYPPDNCLCIFQTMLSPYSPDNTICLRILQTILSVSISSRQYSIGLCILQTILSVSVFSGQYSRSPYSQDNTLCLLIFQTILSVSVSSRQYYISLYLPVPEFSSWRKQLMVVET